MSRVRSRSIGLTGVLILLGLSAGAREVRVTLLHTANLRGHVLSLRYREHNEFRGGMLRLATRIDEVRAESEHVLLVDCGGLIAGSPESALSGGLLPLSALSRMGYDLRLPSLDEWCGDGAGLDPAGIAGNVPYLCANDAPAWRLVVCGGVRIGFVGVVRGPVPIGCTQAPEAPDRATGRALAAVRRESPDVLVLLYYAPGDRFREETRAFCRRFPDFDLVLLGGSGQVLRSDVVGTTTLTEAGADGLWLGKATLTLDTVTDEVRDVFADVEEISSQVPEHQVLRSELGANLGRIRSALDEIIGYAERDIGGDKKWPGQSEMTGLVAASVADRDELVLVARERGGMLSRGKITYRDILRAVPDPGEWAEIQIRPPELRRILEENLDWVSERSFLGATGFTYQAVPGAESGTRIRELRLKTGATPHGRARLTVRFPAYLVQDPALAQERAVLREIAEEPASRLNLLGIDTRNRVMKYIRKHSPVTLRPSRTMTVLPDAT